MNLDAACKKIDDSETPLAEVVDIVAMWTSRPDVDRGDLAILLDWVIGRLRAEAMHYDPKIVEIRTRNDPRAIEQSWIEIERIAGYFMPAVEALVLSGVRLSYVAQGDYAILDAVVQVCSPSLIGYFLQHGAELSPGFAERLEKPGHDAHRKALQMAREKFVSA